MKKILVSPSKYVQGEGEYWNLNDYFSGYGKKVFFIAHIDDKKRVQHYLDAVAAKKEVQMVFGDFGGECTLEEVNKLSDQAKAEQCDVVAGLGGGKALDTAKAVAYFIKKPVMILPTIASTDAPCSQSAVLYTKDGQFDRYMNFKKNPDMVLVDTQIIANAPVRFLVAGIGDALSTYFEARACEKSFADNIPGGKSTKAALAIARQCYETLLEDAVKAKLACECKVVTPALDNIVEANILLSGLGFESSGLAAAHSVHDGLTVLEETHHCYHGEKVSFGTIVQLVLENASSAEIDQVLALCKSVGLPTCLADIGVVDVTREKIERVAAAACAPEETIHNMPFAVKPEDVVSAIYVADKLGSMRK
jgi:glycerol dehydrogenase